MFRLHGVEQELGGIGHAHKRLEPAPVHTGLVSEEELPRVLDELLVEGLSVESLRELLLTTSPSSATPDPAVSSHSSAALS